jgi:chemotaxis protein methyltransferase CheR
MSSDTACVEFLRWALPRLGLRWEGFRRVRRQVCRRLRRRLTELGLGDLDAYREHLRQHPEEWAVLDGLTPITISRFSRDRAVFASIEQDVLPALAGSALAAGRPRLRAWSAGCASGEEPYTLALMWLLALAPRFAGLGFEILATDRDATMLRRARRARYERASLRELPPRWRADGFTLEDGLHVLRPEPRRLVGIRRHDLGDAAPAGPFDLVLCRNAAFTYFAAERQRAVRDRLAAVLRPGGALVLGLHEELPGPAPAFESWGARAVFRRIPDRRACRRR